MQITSNQKILGYLGLARKSGNLSIGVNQVIEQIKKGRARLVILAIDASDKTTNRLLQIQEKTAFSMIRLFTKDELTNTLGGANRTCVAVLNHHLASAIQQVKRG